MDAQEDAPQASSAFEHATEAENAGDAEQGAYSDQMPGGRYHLVDRLSTSAIGAVYKALDTVLDRPVAVKCVRLDTPLADQGPDELRERFVREARIAARLQHPNIVTIHDIVATSNRGYIIMEFIEGRTLESLVESEGRLPLSTAINILSQLSSALDYAHGRNVVHRDVKPANILVSPSMYVWVTDFGIAKSELSTNLTMAGSVLGAPDYMSPEQAKGEDVDSRSDLFSLGCILFEAVVGEKPFRSPSLTGVLLSIINDEPVFPLNWKTLGLPTELKPILHHALEKEREKRYASGAEMMAVLEAISADAVAAVDIAAGASPAAAPDKPADIHEAKVDSTSDAEPAKSDDPLEEVKAEESSTPTASEKPNGEPMAQAKSDGTSNYEKSDETGAGTKAEDSPTGEESVVEAKSDDARQEAKPDGVSDEATPAKLETEPEAAPEEVAEDESAATAKSDEVEVKAGRPEAEAKVGEAKVEEERPAARAELDESETERKADESESEAKSGQPEPKAEVTTEEREDAETEPEEPTASAEEIQSLKDESQVLHLSPSLSGDLQGVEISPEEGFLLSRIDGASRPNDIISVSPMAEADTARTLMDLLGKGLIRLGGVTREPVASASEPPPKPKRQGPDPATVSEVDRLLALAASEDHPGLLGLSIDAPEGKRKSAYLKIVAKFHPDKFPNIDASFREKLARLCSSASEAVSEFEKSIAAKKERESKISSQTNGQAASSNAGAPAPFDKRGHARELYNRASSAYDRANYWDAIQLGRQAVEVDEQVAEFYGLLGRALLQNKKWRKEAADNFLKATELEPHNVEFLGMLGAIYESEGLTTRASTLLEKARALDPDYEFPDLDGREVVTD